MPVAVMTPIARKNCWCMGMLPPFCPCWPVASKTAAPRSPKAACQAHVLTSFNRPVLDSPKAPITPCRQKPSCACENGPRWHSWPKPALLVNVMDSFLLLLVLDCFWGRRPLLYRQAWACVRTISNLINAFLHGQQEIWLTGCRIAAPSDVIAPLKSGPCPIVLIGAC